MELIVVDLSIWLFSLIVATTILALYAIAKISCINNDLCEGFPVISAVRALKKVCPVGFGNKWRLLPLSSGLSRCWSKTTQFPGFQNSTNLCGTACAVSCSSMYAFSLIADVAKWGEWEPLPTTQCLLLKPFSKKLKKDTFMQADQVVGIQRGTDVQSYMAMYRFMSFTEKTVKWILFWNAKNFEFMFFLIQPAVSKTVESQCVITHIFTSKQMPSHLAPVVAQRLRNIKDFLLLSQIHVVSSKYAPAIPVVPTARWYCDKPLDQPSEDQSDASLSDSSKSNLKEVFVLMPMFQSCKCVYNKFKGYHLSMKKMNVEITEKKQKKKEISVKPAPKETLKRSASDTCIKPRRPHNFKSSLNLSSNPRKSLNLKSKTSIIVEENLNLDLPEASKTIWHDKEENTSTSIQEKGESVSEPGMQVSEVRKSSSFSDGSELHTDEETYVNLHVIHENVSRENLSAMDCYERNDIFCSSTSDFELVDTNQQFLDCKIADFLTQGNYGASELQAEMMLASQFNKVLSPEEQFSGSWVYHSTCKGITVLAKTTTGQIMKILSFLCQIEMNVDAKDVWKCVKNPRFRFIYDETVKTVEIIERISNSQKLIHIYHETNGFLKKESIDFCLLQTEREELNSYYSSFHSIEYGNCPFMTSVTRGSLRPSGWVVERLRSERCRVTHMMQILVSSSDSLYIHELSNLVPLAMHNLRTYLASRPK